MLRTNRNLERVPVRHLVQRHLVVLQRRHIRHHPGRPDLLGLEELDSAGEAVDLRKGADDAC